MARVEVREIGFAVRVRVKQVKNAPTSSEIYSSLQQAASLLEREHVQADVTQVRFDGI